MLLQSSSTTRPLPVRSHRQQVQRKAVLVQRRSDSAIITAHRSLRRRIPSDPACRISSICCAAASSSSQPTTPDRQTRWSIWTAIDVAALLGAVGGALAALLGVVSPTYALVLPLVLPVVSLVAALQREDLTKEVSRVCGSITNNHTVSGGLMGAP